MKTSQLRIFDAGPEWPNDRYTILPPRWNKSHRVTARGIWQRTWLALCGNDLGMIYHDEARPGAHLGKRLQWGELPPGMQRACFREWPELVRADG